jgi:hypothetical protein
MENLKPKKVITLGVQKEAVMCYECERETLTVIVTQALDFAGNWKLRISTICQECYKSEREDFKLQK